MKTAILRPVAAALLLAAAACSGGEKSPAPATPPAAPAADARRVDVEKAGLLTGRVVLEGELPQNPSVRVASDPACMRANPDGRVQFEHFVVKDGGLDNVFVYVKDGLGAYHFDAPAGPVRIDQAGCRYTPHVVGARVGQPIEISNSDDTMHNVHAIPDANMEINLAQHVKGKTDVHTFTVAEVMVPFKCDLHSWMTAFVGVVAHPYFAVTSDGGKFELKNLPAGTYTVEAWHEKGGTLTQQVTIGEKELKAVTFTFKPATAN